MKILYLTDTFAPIGGVETYLIELLPLLEERGHGNIVVYRKGQPQNASIGCSNAYHIPMSDSPVIQGEKLKSIVQIENPAIIYVHTLYDPGLIALARSLVPTIGHIHIFYPICPGLGKLFRRGDDVCNRSFGLGCVPMIYWRHCASARNPLSVYRILERTSRYLKAYRTLPRIIVGSKFMKGLMIRNGFASQRVEILPPFVDLSSHVNLTPAQDDGLIILYSGRLEYEKGLPYLLKALQLVEVPFQLLVAGDGSMKDHYMQMTMAFGLERKVKFLGWLSATQLDEVYAQSSVLVLPSIMPEPFGKVGIEAMCHQKPVVAFDVGGISDWLKDGYNGFLVSPKDTGQLASRINTLLSDVKLAQKMGIQARKFVVENYSSRDHVDRLLNIFEAVLLG